MLAGSVVVVLVGTVTVLAVLYVCVSVYGGSSVRVTERWC